MFTHINIQTFIYIYIPTHKHIYIYIVERLLVAIEIIAIKRVDKYEPTVVHIPWLKSCNGWQNGATVRSACRSEELLFM